MIAGMTTPVELRVYYPVGTPNPTETRPCPGCDRKLMKPWYLRRDRERRVWRRWVCAGCHAHQDVQEED